jgi:hypothetical protein
MNIVMNIVNLTPHRIVIFSSADAAELFVVVEPSGQVARVSSTTKHEYSPLWVKYGFPTVRVTFGEVTGLPEYKDGVVYIVSGMVLDAVGKSQPDRCDVYAPGELLRGPDGQPRGCIGLRGI